MNNYLKQKYFPNVVWPAFENAPDYLIEISKAFLTEPTNINELKRITMQISHFITPEIYFLTKIITKLISENK